MRVNLRLGKSVVVDARLKNGWPNFNISESSLRQLLSNSQFLCLSRKVYAEGVRKFQPRVCLETRGTKGDSFSGNSEGVVTVCHERPTSSQPFQGCDQATVSDCLRVSKQTWAGICEHLRCNS
jgi:hypothetical protein